MDTQFFIYLRNLTRGELGISFHTNRPVFDVLVERLWNTILLIGVGQILAILMGVMLGVFAAWKARTAIDYSALITGLLAWSLPTFWLGIILLFWGSNHGFPIGGKMTPGMASRPFFFQLGDPNRIGGRPGQLLLDPTVQRTVLLCEFSEMCVKRHMHLLNG